MKRGWLIAAGVAAALTVGGVIAVVTDETPAPNGAVTLSRSRPPITVDPPTPNAMNWAAFIVALKKIDPDIVHGKEEKAVDRGRNQCRSIKDDPDDQARLIDLTNRRFTSPDHPDGFGQAKAAQILEAVRQYICPTY